MQDGRNMQGEFFLKNNKRADQNKAVQGGLFFSKLINVHANLFGILEYIDKGKLISNCHFVAFKFFQKTSENKSTWGIEFKSNFYAHFFGYEINWPLAAVFQPLFIISKLDIKPCKPGSRLRDMEAESHNWSHFLVSITGGEWWAERWVKVPKCVPR